MFIKNQILHNHNILIKTIINKVKFLINIKEVHTVNNKSLKVEKVYKDVL